MSLIFFFPRILVNKIPTVYIRLTRTLLHQLSKYVPMMFLRLFQSFDSLPIINLMAMPWVMSWEKNQKVVNNKSLLTPTFYAHLWLFFYRTECESTN